MKNAVGRFGIAKRLYLVCLLLTLVLAGVAVAAWLQLDQVIGLADRTGTNRVPQMQRIAEVELYATRVSLQLRHAMLVKTPADLAATLADIADKRKHIEETLADFERGIFTPAGREALAAIKPLVAAFWDVGVPNIKLIEAGKKDEAFTMLVEKTIPARNQLLKVLEAEKQRQGTALTAELQQTKDQASTTRNTLVALVVAVGLGLGAFAVYISALLRRRVSASQAVVEKVRDGDLTVAIHDEGNDEFSPLLAAMAGMRQSLTRLVGNVRSGVESVATASTQIASGNQDLSSRTEEQASNLQETAASLEELTATVKQNTDSAKQASQLASSASEVAARGGAVVEQVVSTMGDIQGSSNKIAEIITVIDGIAFQTNILALNAAVEAARAGEQGRGFAVVAGEVRSLAQRSAQAAREIKALINDSVQRVENGARLVNEAGVTMNEIVAQVRRVTDLIGEITSASLEQSSGISQVNDAVTHLDQVTQQNAALVEESAAAAATLKQQAAHLADAVATFKINQDATGRTIALAPATGLSHVAPSTSAVPAKTAEKAATRPAERAARKPAHARVQPVVAVAKKDVAVEEWAEF